MCHILWDLYQCKWSIDVLIMHCYTNRDLGVFLYLFDNLCKNNSNIWRASISFYCPVQTKILWKSKMEFSIMCWHWEQSDHCMSDSSLESNTTAYQQPFYRRGERQRGRQTETMANFLILQVRLTLAFHQLFIKVIKSTLAQLYVYWEFIWSLIFEWIPIFLIIFLHFKFKLKIN